MPIASYSHSQGCSVTGGYVYRGATYAGPRRASTCSATTARAGSGASTPPGPTAQTPVLLYDTAASISSFGQDGAGNLYLVDRNGDIWLIKDA